MNDKDSFCSFSKFSLTPKVISLKTCLNQCVDMFEDLLTGFDQLCIEADTYKAELMTQKEKCNSKSCPGSEAIKQEMFTKSDMITAAVSYLNKLSCATNSSIYGQLLKILQGEPAILTPPKDNRTDSIIHAETTKLKVITKDMNTPISKEKISPKKDLSSSLEDVSFKEDSVSEIDATPTGKRSPVLQPRKSKNTNVIAAEGREKKKCPQEWSSPRPKVTRVMFEGCTPVKLSRGRGRSRQTRLHWSTVKSSSVVDLTGSPVSSKESLGLENGTIQKLIKKESSENEDTILPSPTSGPTSLILSKERPEFRRPLSLKARTDRSVTTENKPVKAEDDKQMEDMEVSINILQPHRLPKNPKQSPVKVKQEAADNVTHCDTLASASLLLHVQKMEADDQGNEHRSHRVTPKKRPLAENMNAGNLPSEPCDIESSMSILGATAGAKVAASTTPKKSPEKVVPLYKEPTVRKKAEKLALPGWVCDECRSFFGVLYKDDPDMVEKAVARCSKHRGRTDPARPKTPPGYWQPRWTVPDDTEEFNRRNNAV